MTNPKQYYDSPESGRWINRFDVLWIKRDHRRILNAEPKRKEVYYLTEPQPCECGTFRDMVAYTVMIHDFKVLSN